MLLRKIQRVSHSLVKEVLQGERSDQLCQVVFDKYDEA